MKIIKSIDIIDLKIPFKSIFKHNAAARNETQTVIVIVSDGVIKGYGEGCPREYVTNESIDSAFEFFKEVKATVIEEIYDLTSLVEFRRKNKIQIKNNPSAWCAVELALLDLFAKQGHCSIEKLMGLPELSGVFKYTAVIGDDNFEQFMQSAIIYNDLSFNDFKIKISGNLILDKKKLLLLRELNSYCSVRVDANNLWDNENEVVNYLAALPYTLLGIEEPLKERSISKLIELSREISVPIILDESFTDIEQLNELKNYQSQFILNLRVSKLGGLLNTLAIATKAKELEIKTIIGAQVGETSILTRAGISAAMFMQDNYISMEGAFGTFLLEHDIVEKPLMFSFEGKLEAPQMKANEHQYGLGLNINLIY